MEYGGWEREIGIEIESELKEKEEGLGGFICKQKAKVDWIELWIGGKWNDPWQTRERKEMRQTEWAEEGETKACMEE